MNAKVIEIRDRGTFVPALAVRLCSEVEQERYLLRRAGWSEESARGDETDGAEIGVMLYPLSGNKAHTDPYDWGGRTYPVIHQHLLVNWNDVEPGAVLDVEFLLGEVPAPKQSEAVTHG